MVSRRQERIAELLLEELSILVSGELTDPRLADALVTVSDVQVAPDLQSARVFIQHSGTEADNRRILDALRHSHTFLRRQLAENLNLRTVPELYFQVDTSDKRAHRVDEILDRLAHDPRPDDSGAQNAAGE